MLDLGGRLGPIFLAVFYVAIVMWTYKDSRRRIDDPILVASSVAISMLPIVGVLVYMLLRPPEYIADVRERELEIRAMEHSLGRHERCPHCSSHIEADYIACPTCTAPLRSPCDDCSRPLDPRWAICPYCQAKAPRSQHTPIPERSRSTRPSIDTPSRTPKRSTPPRRSTTPEAPKRETKAAPKTERPATSRPEAPKTPSKRNDPPRIADIETEPFSSGIQRNRITGPDKGADSTQAYLIPGIDPTRKA
jgi:hypothetical protein